MVGFPEKKDGNKGGAKIDGIVGVSITEQQTKLIKEKMKGLAPGEFLSADFYRSIGIDLPPGVNTATGAAKIVECSGGNLAEEIISSAVDMMKEKGLPPMVAEKMKIANRVCNEMADLPPEINRSAFDLLKPVGYVADIYESYCRRIVGSYAKAFEAGVRWEKMITPEELLTVISMKLSSGSAKDMYSVKILCDVAAEIDTDAAREVVKTIANEDFLPGEDETYNALKEVYMKEIVRKSYLD